MNREVLVWEKNFIDITLDQVEWSHSQKHREKRKEMPQETVTWVLTETIVKKILWKSDSLCFLY